MEEFDIYNNCLTNLSNSILKYFRVKPFHKSFKLVDEYLEEKRPRHVVLILLDGLGTSILNYHLGKDDFLRKNKKADLFSIIPTATTPATTSLMSGLNPCEHGWIGWDVYFKDIDKNVTLFTNNLKDSNIKAAEYNVAKRKLKYTSIFDLIQKQNKNIHVKTFFPFGNDKYINFDDVVSNIKANCEKYEDSFTYIYCENPDATMHKFGTKSEETHNIIEELNTNIERLSKCIKDAVIIAVADHGHIDSDPIFISDYKELLQMLRLDISVESRACAFFVKKDKLEEFRKIFNKNFSDDFILYDRDEVINKNVFGIGEENKFFKDAIGDFIALGISNKYFRSNRKCKVFVSQHSGITKDELIIPLIIK